jgi:hypothetical protein
MKIIDCSPSASGKNSLHKLFDRGINLVGELAGVPTDYRAEEQVATHLSKYLDHKYILLRNVFLPSLDAPVPLILIGPPGIFVIAASAVKGVYRAKDDTWAIMDEKDRQFEPARPNLVQRTLAMKQAMESFLTNTRFRDVELQAILVCTSTKVHVGSVRPAVRIVMTDGLERFTGNLIQSGGLLTNADVKELAAAVRQLEPSLAEPADREIRDAFAFIEQPQKSTRQFRPPQVQPVLTPKLVSASNKFRLTTGQWIFVGVMLMIEIVMVMAIILFILRTS